MITFKTEIQRHYELRSVLQIDLVALLDIEILGDSAKNEAMRDLAHTVPGAKDNEGRYEIARLSGLLSEEILGLDLEEISSQILELASLGGDMDLEGETCQAAFSAAEYLHGLEEDDESLEGADIYAKFFSGGDFTVADGVSRTAILPHLVAELELQGTATAGLVFAIVEYGASAKDVKALDTQISALKYRAAKSVEVSIDWMAPEKARMFIGAMGDYAVESQELRDIRPFLDFETWVHANFPKLMISQDAVLH